MNPEKTIWVALDTNKTKAIKIAEKLSRHPAVYGFKVNRLLDEEVFRKNGEPALFDILHDTGKYVWVDGKFHDIPRTVVGRIAPYVESGKVQFLTIMAKGEVDMMMDAVSATRGIADIIAVTELTSGTEEQIDLGSGHSSKASVINLARNAVISRVLYLVCSSQELEVIGKRRELASLELFIPGITPAWKNNAPSDQNRIGTPAFVLDPKRCNNKKKLVIGSAIIEADDPWEAVEKTAAEIEDLKA
ncbi:MAG: orotidine 5'-phosphate decarboxylase / HUMPS family protein [Candidatus Moraniibacteriota bacterium]